MIKTGHASDAVRAYKRVSEQKLESLTETILCKKPALENVSHEVCKAVVDSEDRDGPVGSVFGSCTFNGPVDGCTGMCCCLVIWEYVAR